jgi:hypothetical protein
MGLVKDVSRMREEVFRLFERGLCRRRFGGTWEPPFLINIQKKEAGSIQFYKPRLQCAIGSFLFDIPAPLQTHPFTITSELYILL